MNPLDLDLKFPEWSPPEASPLSMNNEAYLAWLSETRDELLRSGLLDKLRSDPARRPVAARFVLT